MSVSSVFAQVVTLHGNPSTEAPVAGYNIYRNGTKVGSSSTTTYVDTGSGLLPSTSYNYSISAFDNEGHESAQSSAISVTTLAVSVQDPGPSLALFNSPVYTCVRNFYVATTGRDSNNGTSPSTPWLTLRAANTASRQPGDCVNVAPGTYNMAGIGVNHGGNASSPTGYVVYRSSTMGAAHLRASSSTNAFVAIQANYVMFDGFEIDGNANTAFLCFVTGPDAGFNAHHVWLTNSATHGCGLSGIQLNSTEYIWVIHNHTYNNSSTSGFMGSGISIFEPLVVSGYTPTAMDLAWSPYHIIINYNVSHDNLNPQNGGATTDGNGIILDDWQHTQHAPNTNYAPDGLVVGNLAYHNGGKGIQLFNVQSANPGTLIANNTAYNNNFDTKDIATWRGEINLQFVSGVNVFNNIAWAIVGTGNLASNTPFAGKGALAATNVWANNISFGAGNNFALPDSFSCSANKCNVDPKLVNAPADNFALQATSPAIGYGQSGTYLPPAPVDAGACAKALTVCP
jgi:hypothetical protein